MLRDDAEALGDEHGAAGCAALCPERERVDGVDSELREQVVGRAAPVAEGGEEAGGAGGPAALERAGADGAGGAMLWCEGEDECGGGGDHELRGCQTPNPVSDTGCAGL